MSTNLDFKAISASGNVLTRFRSYNPIFTLSAVRASTLSPGPDGGLDTNLLDQDVEKFMIAKSGGKGDSSVNADSLNPGEYDFYFDNVEIQTLPGFNKKTNYSKATSIKFSLFEPYSVGGLFEALSNMSQQVGSTGFQNTVYVLRLQFSGYTDSDDTTIVTPDNTTRYFTMRFTGIDVKVDISGTTYECHAVPSNELAFADSNKLPTNINVVGNTVGEMITDFFNKINSTIVQQYTKSLGLNIEQDDHNHDTYQCFFPSVDDNGFVDYTNLNSSNNKLWSSNVIPDSGKDIFDTDNIKPTDTSISPNGTLVQKGTVLSTVKSQDPRFSGYTPPTSSTPPKPGIQFSQGANIHDCISAILRDCDYIRNNVAQLPNGGLDSNGMFQYFYVQIQTVPNNAGKFDFKNAVGVSTITYIVFPYKMHISRLPLYQSDPITAGTLTKRIRRTYNYLYTGKNTEIINFDLKFNNLYFQTRSINQGNNSTYRNTIGAMIPSSPSTTGALTYSVDQNSVKKSEGIVAVPVRTHYKSSENIYYGQGTAPPPANPAGSLAQNVHQAILEDVNMIQVDLEIVGDPFYLVQGGIGNIISKPYKDSSGNTLIGITDKGDADHQSSDIYVQVNVNSITDVAQAGGSGNNNTPYPLFSGIYRVMSMVSSFQGGFFKQKLELIRINSEPVDETSSVPTYTQQGK